MNQPRGLKSEKHPSKHSSPILPPLQVVHLSKSYKARHGGGEVEAVRDISFEVAPGECFGLLGPNGAGKSTTIQCLSSVFIPSVRARFSWRGITSIPNPSWPEKIWASATRKRPWTATSTPWTSWSCTPVISGYPPPRGKGGPRTCWKVFGLADKAKENVEALSGGMKRRLQVARALISEPRVLVLDEPTTGLDPDVRRMLWEALTEARSKGTAILLCTHYMDEAERLCDRIAILSQGKILDVDSPEKLIAKHIARTEVEEEVRPGVIWKRRPNLEDVYLKLTGSRLGVEGL